MDVANLIFNINNDFGTLIKSTWGGSIYSKFKNSESYVLHIATAIVAFSILILILMRRWHKKAAAPLGTEQQGMSRFRKRDKALFYGRKMLRKVKNIGGQVRNSGQGRKRKMVMRFARRILQLKKDNDSEQLKVLEPPAEYLQEETSSEDRMPPDALYMLQSIRVFGQFEKPVFLRLCKHTEVMNVPAGTYLFKIGDVDENVYVVQSGKLNVFIAASDGALISLKIVKTGESITSLLSFTDVLMGTPSLYKSVSAKAIEDSTVVKLPMAAFQDVFDEYPDIFIRVMQVIMVRLQRVTFTALHQYLGLSAELMNQGEIRTKTKSRVTLAPSLAGVTRKSKVAEDYAQGPSGTSDLNQSQSQSQFLAMGHRRSRSTFDPKHSFASPSYSTPDMVPNVEHFTANVKKRASTMIPSEFLDEQHCIRVATEAFVRELGLDDEETLKGKVEVREVTAGTYLMKEDSNKDVALVYILAGDVIVSQRISESEEEVTMFTAYPGEILGGLAVLTGEPSFFTIRAKHNSKIALLTQNTFYSLMKDQPKVVLYVAHMVVKRLSPFVRQVDFALDWVFLESGRAVYRQDEESDSTFIVLSGRLRSVITHANGKKELVGEYGKGDLIGVVEMVTHTKRSTTVIAVRDSELAKLPEGLFNAIKLRFPIVVTRLINLLGRRILGMPIKHVSCSWQNANINVRPSTNSAVETSRVNFSTVAIVAASDDVPLTAFTYELYHCLSAIGPTLRLTSDVVRKTLGSTVMDMTNEYRLTCWLAQQEDQHKISLYQCDLTFTAWTQRCIRQADCILIVGLGENSPTLGKVEKEIDRLAIRTQKELVLLHKEGVEKPKNTVAWLNTRTFITAHHHVLSSKRMFSRRSLYRINELYKKVCMSEPNVHSDFSRLARWLTGKSVGLVLGGGGARGAAHVGMIKAIQEAGIPIDMVGGVSIGSFMGALWCQERNVTTMTQKAREWSKKMTQWWRQILDLTYPVTSMFSGRDFNQTIKATFGDTYIEDLWLPYFAVTTDITASSMRVHSHGSLWRYVRASMSLSGYMPPLCDPVDGHLLLDGGYVNNLPADVMRGMGANHILAVDVGSVDDTDLTNYGDDLSGWWLLWKRWNPFTSNVKVPNLPDIQSRLAYVSCVRQLEEVKNSDYCEYIRPPIDKYKTLQFGSFDEIREVGYNYGKSYFEGQKRAGCLPVFKSEMQKTSSQGVTSYTFTDLAQMVCKVQRQYDEDSSSSSSDDEFGDGQGYASEPTVGFADNYTDELLRRRRAGGSLSLSENELDSDYNVHLDEDDAK